jgi:hypothetical protein
MPPTSSLLVTLLISWLSLCYVLQGVTTGIAYQHGVGSSAFALAVALSSIVMYDAAGVRRHAGACCALATCGCHAAGSCMHGAQQLCTQHAVAACRSRYLHKQCSSQRSPPA